MDSNYKNIKKLLSEEQTELPSDLDWDKMQEGIMSSMKELQVDSRTKRKRTITRRLFFMGLIMLLILTPFICTQLNEVQNQGEVETVLIPGALSQNKSNSNVSPVNAVIDKNDENDKSGYSYSENLSTENPNKNLEEKKQGTIAKSAPNQNNSFPNLNNSSSSGVVSPTQKHPNNYYLKSMQSERKNNAAQSNQFGADPNSPLTGTYIQSSKDNGKRVSNEKPIIVVGAIENSQFKLEYDFKSLYNPNLVIEEIEKNSSFPIRNRLSLTTGASFWNMGFGSNKPERQPFESHIISFNSSLNYLHTFNDNLILMIGLNYQQLENRLDWSEIVNDHEVLLTDIVIEVQHNILTGMQNMVRGNATVEVAGRRIVRHFNKTQLIQVPLALGKTWLSGNWQADVLAGGNLNIYSNNVGRTLYQGSILDYSGSTTEFVNNQWKINALAVGRVTYNINNKMGISTGVLFQKSISNWSTEEGITMRPYVINLDFGLTFSL